MLTLDQLPQKLQSDGIRNACIQNKYLLDISLDKFASLPIDQRINSGKTFSTLLRDRAITRRMLADPVYARKTIGSNLMHFNAHGHCYSYTLKRFFH